MASTLGPQPKRSGGRRTFQARSDVNITPLVDVMLVLMIIFMVTAPLLTVGIPVDLPQANGQPSNSNEEPVVVSLNNEGKIFLQETEITLETLMKQLAIITQNNPNAPLFVRGDQSISYGKIIELMSAMAEAGYKKVALMAESAPSKNLR